MITGKVELEMKNLVIAFVAAAAACSAFGVEISPILEGKLAAFSFTYDDGAYSHYTTALCAQHEARSRKREAWRIQACLF